MLWRNLLGQTQTKNSKQFEEVTVSRSTTQSLKTKHEIKDNFYEFVNERSID